MYFERQLRMRLFDAALDFLESESLDDKAVCGCMKDCIEFFMGGTTPNGDVTRDFCMTKLHRVPCEG